MQNQGILSGISYLTSGASGSSFSTITHSTKANEDIFALLDTPINSIFLNPEYGSRLSFLIFEPNDYILADLVEMEIREVIPKWLPNIQILEVKVKPNENEVLTRITYRFTNSNTTSVVDYSISR